MPRYCQKVAVRDRDGYKQLLWYFAYGSNMSREKFTYGRGIIPLATANVELPGWCLTMEVPGLPYSEPGMSSIARHEVLYPPTPASVSKNQDPGFSDAAAHKKGHDNEQQTEPRIPPSRSQNVMGVAYLITPEQYVHVVCSEGGGIAYNSLDVPGVGISARDRDVLSCYGGDSAGNIRVRTLVNVSSMSRRGREPLPSERYKGLLVTGAAEAELPQLYQEMLEAWPSFKRPARRMVWSIQRDCGKNLRYDDCDEDNVDEESHLTRYIGALIFLAVWTPLLAAMEKLTYRYIKDEDGLVPRWVKWVVRTAVWIIWWSHDVGFAPIFGRGDGREDLDRQERTTTLSETYDWRYGAEYRLNVRDCEEGRLLAEYKQMPTLPDRVMKRSRHGTKAFWTILS